MVGRAALLIVENHLWRRAAYLDLRAHLLQAQISRFASQLGHPMSERVMNDVHYLRTEGRDLDRLGTSIIVELYGIPRNAELGLITEGFEWPPKT